MKQVILYEDMDGTLHKEPLEAIKADLLISAQGNLTEYNLLDWLMANQENIQLLYITVQEDVLPDLGKYWKDVPWTYKFMAVDADGIVHAYTEEPKPVGMVWFFSPRGEAKFMKVAHLGVPCKDWKNTLVQRPDNVA